MQKFYYMCLIASLCYNATASAAAPIYKCITHSGAVTFNDTGCPDTASHTLLTLPPTMVIPALPQSAIESILAPTASQPTRLTVISDTQHPCGAFDTTQRRTDLVRKQVKSGMSRAEVESMFGRPLSQRNHNGTISAVYHGNMGQQRSVRFNQHGCVP